MDTRLIDCSDKFGSAWLSCMTFMVEGDITSWDFYHCLKALQVASSATLAYVACMILLHKDAQWLNILLIGVVTAVFDFSVHPTHFGPIWGEAVATGVGAMLFSTILERIRKTKPRY